MTGGVTGTHPDTTAGLRSAAREPRRLSPEASASFGRAIEDALAKFAQLRPGVADRADRAGPSSANEAATEPPAEPGPSSEAPPPDAAVVVDGRSAELPPERPPQGALEPVSAGRATPVALLLAVMALEANAAAARTEATPPDIGQPSEAAPWAPPRTAPAQAVVPPVAAEAAFRRAPDERGAAREPLPVAVVTASVHAPPAQPVPVQIAAALGGEVAAMAAPASALVASPQPAARLITIALAPPELGSLLVRLRLTGRGLEVAIAAQPQSIAAVRDGLDDIARALHGQGIAVEALNVRVAEWRELAAAVAAAPRPDAAAGLPTQSGSQPPAGGEAGFGGRTSGEGFGSRRGAAGDSERQNGRERRENDSGNRQALGGVGAGDGRYV